jgi:hypothetical protein
MFHFNSTTHHTNLTVELCQMHQLY